MDRYPYFKPPRWWSPKPSRSWMKIWRPWRRFQQIREYRVVDIQVRGLELLRDHIDQGHGVLITPNHAGHADCFALFHALEKLPQLSQVMTAWQVFDSLPKLQRLVYRHHGCFSIDRESNDLQAFRWAVRVLQQTSHPLVIFPEGEVYHLNDFVTPFRDGTLSIAMNAVRRSSRPIGCFPCAIRYVYLEDPTPALREVMSRLEQCIGQSPRGALPLDERLRQFTENAIALRERQHQGTARDGALQPRIDALADVILRRVETRLDAVPSSDFVPERVRQLRHLAIGRAAEMPAQDRRRVDIHDDLENLFVAVQLYSYRADYLDDRPSLERMAETIDKYEEDFLGATTASIRGTRQATIRFGEPIVVSTVGTRDDVRRLGETLRGKVQSLLGPTATSSSRVTSKPISSII